MDQALEYMNDHQYFDCFTPDVVDRVVLAFEDIERRKAVVQDTPAADDIPATGF